MGAEERQKLRIGDIRARKAGPKLAMIAAYDAQTARLAESAGMDLILVGDSLGMVVLGYESTVPVTLTDIIHHCRAVRRGAPATHVVADLPFLTYQISDAQAITSAGRLIKDGGADAVKLEGGRTMAPRVRAIVDAGIPVMGHIGMTPQSAALAEGFRVRGRDLQTARDIIADAEAIAEAGAYALVIELVPAELAELITKRVTIPTIGIGAGPACDGQVLVAADLLGMDERFTPRFVKRYATLGQDITRAFAAYIDDVRTGAFPAAEHKFTLSPAVLDALEAELGVVDSERMPR
ncbi:MAG: 3-methyl-2-oxobutanoate hydroxymethyltransferase [Thermomicrobiales bacterium]|nr:MAG: 3-methyl-2-oxobutanoate hydroxymethyltransferase [Thermomicrobiales bacterium]